MDEFGNLCERVLFRLLVSRWIPGIDAFLPSTFSFSPKQSGCPTQFYIHSTCLPYVSFNFDVVRIFSLCLWMALEKQFCGLLVVSRCSFSRGT
jgi:hypothetical protein